MLKKFIAILSVALVAQFGATSAMAEENTGFSILIAPGHIWFDEDDIDDTGTVNIGIGYRFSKHWGIEAAWTDWSETNIDGIPGLTADADGYRVDALYYFNESNGYLPYIVAGAGELDFDFNVSGASFDDTQTFANLGVGVKKYITPHLAIRADVRAVKIDDLSGVNTHAMLGLDYFFGDRGSKPVAVAAAAPMDSDGDGVIDANDACPGTTAGVAVDAKGCPLDSDKDGVADFKDQCPKTPKGARVDEKGCQYVITETASVELEVLFDLNKAEVKPEFMADINLVGEFLTLFPKTSAKIEGHTDTMGDEGFNQMLSQKRAEAVRDILVKEHKIDVNRLEAIGYGESKPRASNDTREGRKSNRRVVSIITTKVEKTLQ